jgi:hypothetical protein
VKQSVPLDPPDWSRPYGHLLPVVDVLVAGGNRVIRGGFYKNADGWRCELVDPLDFELLRKTFRFPESICLAEGRNLVLCRRTWAAIEGAKARSNSEIDVEAKPLLTLVEGKAADMTGGRSEHGRQRTGLAISVWESRR